jgi:hypothetical protein
MKGSIAIGGKSFLRPATTGAAEFDQARGHRGDAGHEGAHIRISASYSRLLQRMYHNELA